MIIEIAGQLLEFSDDDDPSVICARSFNYQKCVCILEYTRRTGKWDLRIHRGEELEIEIYLGILGTDEIKKSFHRIFCEYMKEEYLWYKERYTQALADYRSGS